MLNLDPNSEFGARVQRRLGEDPVAWLTTVGKTGTPYSVPVWFLQDGDEIIIYSQPGKPKLRNIERNPRINLHLNSDAGGGDIIVLTGSARIDPGTPPVKHQASYLAKYADDIRRIGFTPETFSAEYSTPIRFTPERLSGY